MPGRPYPNEGRDLLREFYFFLFLYDLAAPSLEWNPVARQRRQNVGPPLTEFSAESIVGIGGKEQSLCVSARAWKDFADRENPGAAACQVPRLNAVILKSFLHRRSKTEFESSKNVVEGFRLLIKKASACSRVKRGGGDLAETAVAQKADVKLISHDDDVGAYHGYRRTSSLRGVSP
jgi:hypothetical protein